MRSGVAGEGYHLRMIIGKRATNFRFFQVLVLRAPRLAAGNDTTLLELAHRTTQHLLRAFPRFSRFYEVRSATQRTSSVRRFSSFQERVD